ncbi:hypothetical protein MY5147_009162 [Beauveria neobassiana]
MGNMIDNSNAGQPTRRIRRPPPLTVELVLSQPEGLGESEHLMSSQAGAFESRVSEFLEHRADEAFHQSTDMLDWEAILLGHSPRPHECLQMSGAARSQGELLPSLPDFAFIDVDGTSADTYHARVPDVLASADGSRYLHTNALCCAVDNGLIDMTQCLLRAGAEPMRRDKTGRTALHYAARHSDAAILNGLLALEVNIDVKDSQGPTSETKYQERKDGKATANHNWHSHPDAAKMQPELEQLSNDWRYDEVANRLDSVDAAKKDDGVFANC